MKNELIWYCKHFDELTVEELYNLLALRTVVFVVEQNCAYQELDGIDKKSYHLFALHKEKHVAYLRIVPPGLSYAESSIGRVVVEKSARKKGVGDELMRKGMATLKRIYGEVSIRIGAQTYLQDAYQNWGFEKVGEPYIEDGIPHLEMLYTPSK